MVLFIGGLIGGIGLGGVYALTSLGLVFAFRATKTFNFAHGELMLLPAFIVGYLQLHNVALGLAVVVALASSTVAGGLFYVLVLRRTTGLSLFMGIVATFGLAAILDGILGIFFSEGQYSVVLKAVPSGSITILGAHVSEASLILAGFTLALAVLIALLVRFTHIGITIKAAGQDPLLASQCGIPVRWLYMGSWAVAGLLAGVAGISYASQSVANTSLIDLALAAIPAIVLGGMDSIDGAVIGGLVIGLAQGFTQIYLGGNYVDLVTYSLLLVVLLVYPQGLFGTKEIVRA
jgi:branched-chain amino acid transport system permease protein